MKKLTPLIAGSALLLPMLALAITPAERVLFTIQRILDIVIPIVITLALIYFFWGLAKFILSAGDEEKRKESRGIMIWGIIALFVMVSVWGLVRFIGGTFGVQEGGAGIPPTVLR